MNLASANQNTNEKSQRVFTTMRHKSDSAAPVTHTRKSELIENQQSRAPRAKLRTV